MSRDLETCFQMFKETGVADVCFHSDRPSQNLFRTFPPQTHILISHKPQFQSGSGVGLVEEALIGASHKPVPVDQLSHGIGGRDSKQKQSMVQYWVLDSDPPQTADQESVCFCLKLQWKL